MELIKSEKINLSSNLSWWLEIHTIEPLCIYYFGPFNSSDEANFYESGYIEDLIQEKAQGITVESKRCQPQMLTIYEDLLLLYLTY